MDPDRRKQGAGPAEKPETQAKELVSVSPSRRRLATLLQQEKAPREQALVP